MADTWQNNQAIRALAARILDRLDARPLEERTRRVTFRLSEKTFPELYLAGPDDADYLWSLLERMSSAHVVAIETDPRRGASRIPRERSPTLVIGPEFELAFRIILSREPTVDPWTEAWQSACRAAQWLPDSIRPLLSVREHRVGNRTASDVLGCWERLSQEPFDGLGLREVAARLFWGLSKALDDKHELVNAVREAKGHPPLPERPLLLPTFLSETWREKGVLFVENLSAYAACLAGRANESNGMAIVYSSGYRGAARRLRKLDMALFAFDPRGSREAESAYVSWFIGGRDDVPTYFWGDLDYAGLAILRELRHVFRGMQAWSPGYAPMVAALERGHGHTPAEADKCGQEDPGIVGCQYADEVLRAVLGRTHRFFDQEGV